MFDALGLLHGAGIAPHSFLNLARKVLRGAAFPRKGQIFHPENHST
jgi:hypothetical protein